MELIYFFICIGIIAIVASIWGYIDYRRSEERSENLSITSVINSTTLVASGGVHHTLTSLPHYKRARPKRNTEREDTKAEGREEYGGRQAEP